MPVTWEQHEKKLDDPALCELLPVRDYLDNVLVRTKRVRGIKLNPAGNYDFLRSAEIAPAENSKTAVFQK